MFADCPTPSTNSHSSVSVNGNVATYTCDNGYQLSGSSQRTCSSNGQWNGVAPHCFSCSQYTYSSILLKRIQLYKRFCYIYFRHYNQYVPIYINVKRLYILLFFIMISINSLIQITSTYLSSRLPSWVYVIVYEMCLCSLFLLLLFWTFELVNTYYFFLSITVVLCV